MKSNPISVKNSPISVKKLTTLAMLCAIAYALVCICRIPLGFADFLKYEPKDVIIVIGGFTLGPIAALVVSLVVSALELMTISTTGPIGMLMNVLSTCAFTCTAALIYKRKHTMKGAVISLAVGVIFMTGVMLLWNYFITPLYEGVPRAVIKEMLLPVFLPFNLIKGCLNMAITLLVYKPIVTALRKIRLLEGSSDNATKNMKAGAILLAVLLLASCILAVLSHKGII